MEDLTLATAERRAIERALRHTAGNKCAAADTLGVSRSTLYRKMHLYEITYTPDERTANDENAD